MTATLVTPSSRPTGFSQNDIATCIYPAGIVPNIAAVKAWRNITKSDPTNFSVSTAASVGDTLEYRVIVRNSGIISAGNTTFQDTIPNGVTYTTASTTLNGTAVTDSAGTGNTAFIYKTAQNINSPGQGTGVLKVDSTPATTIDDEATVVFRVTVNNPFNGASPIPNTAQINYAGASAAINSNTVNTPVLLPDLRIDKSHTGNFTRGANGTYTITVTNGGTAPTVGTITVTDTLPTGLSVNGGLAGAVTIGGTNTASWTCSSNAATPQIVTCTSPTAISNVSGGSTSVFTLTVNVALTAAASVTNSVSVAGGNEPAVNNGNNTDSDPTVTEAGSPNVSLTKTCPSPANCESAAQMPGTDLTYKIVFANTGGLTAANLRLVDAIPLDTDFKLASATANFGLTGLTFVIEYSNDYDPLNPASATWSHTPVTAGGGATTGYDRLVKAIRWRVTLGALSNISPNNTGDVGFTVKIR